MVAVERPASLSWAGATRNTTPSEKPPSSIRVTAPAISGLRRARPSAAVSRSCCSWRPSLPWSAKASAMTSAQRDGGQDQKGGAAADPVGQDAREHGPDHPAQAGHRDHGADGAGPILAGGVGQPRQAGRPDHGRGDAKGQPGRDQRPEADGEPLAEAGSGQEQAGRERDAAVAEPVAGDSAGDGSGDDREARRREGDSRFEPGQVEGVAVGRQQRHQRHQRHLVHEDQRVEQDQEPSHRPSLWVVSSDDAASPDPRVQPRAPGADRGGAAPAGRGGGAAGHLGGVDRRLRGGAPGVDRAAARGRAGALAGPAARGRRLAGRGAAAGSARATWGPGTGGRRGGC